MRLFPARNPAVQGAAFTPTLTRRKALKRLALLVFLVAAAVVLTACAALSDLAAQTPAQSAAQAGPNLMLLSLPAYDDPEATAADLTAADGAYALVDLWLDATQNMGGIDGNETSMYPHSGKKYREGGFQYHYGTRAGWYESLLRDFLAAAGDARVRALRYGNETFPDAFLASYGLTAEEDAASASIWRDLHTVTPAASARLFSQMSAEDMAGSFYALGSSVWLNRLAATDAAELENPTLAAAMSAALDAQTLALSEGDPSFVLTPDRDDATCALLAALPNLDESRLTVITVDPTSVRRTSGSDAAGVPVGWYEQALRKLGVFDRGLCVGVLDFKLDYLGQMSTLGAATFTEPLIWGRVILDEKKQTFDHLGVMPRRMLTLVTGTRARVNGFIQSLSDAIDADRSLRGLRGPENGELTYAANGETVTQQPFTFEWNHTVIARPGMGYYTQRTEGATLTTESADGAAADAEQTVTASPAPAETQATPDARASAETQANADANVSAETLDTPNGSASADTQANADANVSAGALDTPDAQANADANASPAVQTAPDASALAKATGAPDNYTGAQTAASGEAEAALSANATTVSQPQSDALTAETGADGLPLLRLLPKDARQPDRVLTLRFPIAENADGAVLDVSTLTGAGIEPIASLLLSQTLQNTPQNAATVATGGAQSLAYRDKLYVFSNGADATPFTLTSITQENGDLVCRVAVAGNALLPGYYRMRLKADVTGKQVAWESVPWIDGSESVAATVTESDVYAWETFTAAMTAFDRDAKGLPKMFQHAWGPYTERLYHGLRVPDFPPVYKSVGLKEIAGQIRNAAASDQSPLIRYTFTVFVGNP